MQRTKPRDRVQLRVFHFPKVYVFSEGFDLKPTRMAVPDTWRQPKAALSLRFAAALHSRAGEDLPQRANRLGDLSASQCLRES